MSTVLLRKLTFKSVLGFGNYSNETVQRMFELYQQKKLIAAYYKLDKITFIDEILNKLGITEQYRIAKPGKDKKMHGQFMFEKHGKVPSINKKLEGMRKETQSFRKDFLSRFNHGHR